MKTTHQKNIRMLQTAKGQIEGLIKMIQEDRYCIDISNQMLATCAIIKKVNKNILTNHLKSCVINAQTPEEKEQKLNEISQVIAALSK